MSNNSLLCQNFIVIYVVFFGMMIRVRKVLGRLISLKELKNEQRDSKKELKPDISLYYSTYETVFTVMTISGLRVGRNDSSLPRILFNCWYWFGMFNLFYAGILEMLYMVQVGQGGTFEDAVAIFTMMPCVGYVVMAQVKTYKMYFYRPVFENLIAELADMWPRGPVTEEEYDVLTKPIKKVNFICKAYFWCNRVLLAFFIVPHVIALVRSWMGYEVKLELPFFFWLPFDPYQKFVYEFILVLQSWEAIVTVYLILSCDLLFCVFITHLTTQFDLLSIRIRKIIYVPTDNQLIEEYPLAKDSKLYLSNNRNTVQTHSAKEWEDKYLKDFNDILKRHRKLLRLSADVESMFSLQLLFNFIDSSVIICFCGFCSVIVEKWNEFIYKFFLASALIQMWVFCWYGQRLLESSSGVANALYNSGWYVVSKSVRLNISIMLHRAQNPTCMTAYGFTVISLTSFTTIIKTAWSYLTLLLNAYK